MGGEEMPYAIQVDQDAGTQHGLGITVGKWEVGLFGCCTHMVPNCCMVFCCPCVSLAQISARLGKLKYDIALVLFVLLFFCTGGTASLVGLIWLWQTRAQTRERFQIPGSCCGDFCASCFCGCCTMTQIATHIKSYKPGSCNFSAQNTLPPYERA